MCLIFRLIKRVQITILLMLACNNLFCLDGLELILFFIFIRLIGVTVVELREHLLHLYFIIYHLKRQKKKKKKKKKGKKINVWAFLTCATILGRALNVGKFT
jgi:hypothetical protein